MSEALARYWQDVFSQGEYLSDWLTHLPALIQPIVQTFGRLLTVALGL